MRILTAYEPDGSMLPCFRATWKNSTVLLKFFMRMSLSWIASASDASLRSSLCERIFSRSKACLEFRVYPGENSPEFNYYSIFQ